MSNRKNPYLFYTEYYIISGAYHVVNVVHDVLTYTASYSDNIKGYLHSKVINKKILLDEIVNSNNNNCAAKNNDTDVDEDGFVVIRMRRPKIKNNASAVTDVVDTVAIPVTNFTNSMTMTTNLDNTLANSIINSILNDILDNLDKHALT